jgi:flagellar export protein FliJ
MKRSNRLRSIARHASTVEVRAARAFATDLAKVERARARIEQLQAYCTEYGDRQREAGPGSVAAAHLKNLNRFVLDLDKAIAIAAGRLEQAQSACESHRERWREARAHARAVEELIARCRAMEARLALAREQSEQDERAGREGRGAPGEES